MSTSDSDREDEVTTSSPLRSIDCMEDETFIFGATQLIQALPVNCDDQDALRTIQFVLTTVNKDVSKLGDLIDIIYDHADPKDPRDNKTLFLFTNLLRELSGTDFFVNRYTTRSTKRSASAFALETISARCYNGFNATADALGWDCRPFYFIEELAGLGVRQLVKARVRVAVQIILDTASKSQFLFEQWNFRLFVRLMTAHGSLVNTECMSVIMSLVTQRAKEESLGTQLMVAGLLSVRDKEWSVATALGQETSVKLKDK
ncbi:hypothetical protein C7974DRAFT_195870 [Boeremia exigua]|uniref:uncharacterized protein n=1 Tax=Boeremia exigua TaxID=749465 RepID=UPI001E8E4D0C|nr:uncharacterized protein C7974DRAFT_195870 [Boeremia exigua]KAH6625176.1 hypothetical protein C7974DRAFT_195870 [Boeremia exigua]